MYPANRSLNRQIALALYMLKREYGGTITIYKLLGSTTDVRTGERVVNSSATRIDRAVVLPCTIKRKVNQGVSFIHMNKTLVTAAGGGYDNGKRDFIVDRLDCPQLPSLSPDDWLVYGTRKYQIEAVDEFEFDAGWVITGSAIVGQSPEADLSMSGATSLGLTSHAET